MDSSTHRGTKRRKIALFGAFGVGNLGNECTLQALLSNIRKYAPDPDIRCICPGPNQVRLAYNISATSIEEVPFSRIENRALRILRRIFVRIPVETFRWIKAIAAIRDVDLLIMTGTGMLGDFGIGPLDLHYQILKWTLLAKLCRCRVIFLSVGAGPLRHPLSQRIVKAALSFADYRSYRDSFSKTYLESIGFDTQRDHVFPDLAFSFPMEMLPHNSNNGSNRPVVGLGIMTYFNRTGSSHEDDSIYTEYIAKMGSFVSWLLEKKYKVRLLIGDVAYDQPAIRDLKAYLEKCGIRDENGAIIDEAAASVDEVLLQLATTDFVVASRFHNILLALMLAKPVLAVSYHEKTGALMASAGLAEFCQDIENIDADRMIGQFQELEATANLTKQRLQRNAETCRFALDEQYNRIFNDHLLMATTTIATGTRRKQGDL